MLHSAQKKYGVGILFVAENEIRLGDGLRTEPLKERVILWMTLADMCCTLLCQYDRLRIQLTKHIFNHVDVR